MALLANCTARLRAVYPEVPQAQTPLPESLNDYRIEIFEGKAIKRVAKRLKPLWGLAGGVLGAGLGRHGHAQRLGHGHVRIPTAMPMRYRVRGRLGPGSAAARPREAALAR